MYLNEGFEDYLSKPMEVRDLVEKLRKYLPESAYRDSTSSAAGSGDADILEFTPEDDGEVIEFTPGGEDTADRKSGIDRTALGIAGIDVTSGLAYCANDESLYAEMLSDFASSCEEKLNALGGFLETKNWKDYGIKVHALKSNARMIGAESLSALALRLEEAAKSGDGAFVTANHKALAEEYARVSRSINL